MAESFVRPYRDGYRVAQIGDGRLETQCWWSRGGDQGEWRFSGQSRYTVGEALALTAAFLAALRAHDPAAHRALAAAEARAAGLTVLVAGQSLAVQRECPMGRWEAAARSDPWFARLVAALRGDPQPEEVPPS